MQYLKMQREENKRKKDTKLQLAKDEANKNQVEVELLCEKFKSNACWENRQDVEEGFDSMTSKINQLLALKVMTTTCDKCLG